MWESKIDEAILWSATKPIMIKAPIWQINLKEPPHSILEQASFYFCFLLLFRRRFLNREILLIDVIGGGIFDLAHWFSSLPEELEVLALPVLALLSLEIQVVPLINLLDIHVAATLEAVLYLTATVCIVVTEAVLIILLPGSLLSFSSRLLVSHYYLLLFL